MNSAGRDRRRAGLAIVTILSVIGALSVIARPVPASAAAGDIVTVAGGFTGDGGPASAARLNKPFRVAVDAAGNVYITDTYQHRIRKIDAGTGTITTVAGNGISAFAGDGGQAAAASIYQPAGLALDGAGDLFIADSFNQRVREVDTSGVITTVAGNGDFEVFSGDGGPATAATMNYPHGVAVDASGNLFIADAVNHRIREVLHSSGTITTVAGNGIGTFAGDGGPAVDASLNYPADVVRDAAGNLYIADTFNNRIRKVDTLGNITTVAGNGTPGYDGDGPDATQQSLNYPYGIALDAAGNLYIADTYNHRIRKVDTSGAISTVAGTGAAGFSGDGGDAAAAALNTPSGVAVDADGNIYIADKNNDAIRKVNASDNVINTIAGGLVDTYRGDNGPATDASLNLPHGIAVDASGDVYVADTYNFRIREILHSSGTITTVAGDGNAGYVSDNVPAVSTTVNYPYGISLDAAGNLYIADTYNHRIRKVDTSGVITTVAGTGSQGYGGDGGPATSALLDTPRSIATDTLGNLYIADSANNRVRKITYPSGTITTIAGNGSAGYDGDGPDATQQSLDYPTGVAVDPAGNVYIADSANHRVRMVSPSGAISTIAGDGIAGYTGDNGPAASARLSTPYGVAVDPTGALYIADFDNSAIRKISGGIITTVAGNGAIGFSGDGGPAAGAILFNTYSIAIDPAGNVYFPDVNNWRVRKITESIPPQGTVTINGGAAFTNSPAVSLALSCTDAGGTCTEMEISDTGSTYPPPLSYATSADWALTGADGIKTVYARFTDASGNLSTAATDTIALDTTPPVTTALATGFTFSTWTSAGTVTFSLSALDPVVNGTASGLAAGSPRYCVDATNTCTPSTTYTAPVGVSCPSGSVCTRYVRYRSVDIAGNTEPTGVSTVLQDLQAPSTTASAAGYTFGTVTSSGTVTVTLSATDAGSGIEAGWPRYCVSTSPGCTPDLAYDTGIAVSCAQGSVCTQYVSYASADTAGNTETPSSREVDQDLQAPTLDPSAVFIDSTHVDVTFSEAVSNAAISANYSADNGLQITGAALQSGTTYRLTTGVQTVNTPYTITASTANITDAVGNTLSPTADTASFTRQSSTNTPPTTPVLNAPASDSETTSVTPPLTITNSTDVDSDPLHYEFEVDTVATFDSPAMLSATDVAAGAGTTGWTTPALADNTTYYWRARASDGDKTSLWMPTANFFVNTANDTPTVPAVSSPADGTQVSVLTPTLSVTNASDIDKYDTVTYDFDVSPLANFSDIVSNVIGEAQGTGTTEFLTAPLLDNTTYYWRARARDNHGAVSAWVSASFFVNTSNDAPTAPALSAPANTSELAQQTPALTVVNSTDLDHDVLHYVFEVDRVNTFDSPDKQTSGLIPEGTGTTTWTPATLADNTVWYWRAKANDGQADSAWMTTASFFVNMANDPPTAPVLSNPADGGAVTVLTPALQVLPATDVDGDALTYEYEVFSDQGLANLVTGVTGAGTIWTVDQSLNDNTWYWWHARARDTHGAAGNWMPAAKFFVNNNGFNDPPSITVTSPAAAEPIVVGSSFTITWTAADPDSDPLISLYYDTTGSGHSGGVQIAANLPMSGASSFDWDITSLAEGTYYVYAKIDDGTNVVYAYASGPIIRLDSSGDIDGNGEVDMIDALQALRFAVGIDTPTAEDIAHADVAPLVNGKPAPDGRIDLADVVVILRKAAHLTSW